MLSRLREAGLLWPAVMSLAALPLLIGLGVWQLDRLAWKEALIARIAERTSAVPVQLAAFEAADRDAGGAEYLHVRARGRFLHDKALYMYAPDPDLGPGFHVYVPLQLQGGKVLLVNRGFVPETLRDPKSRSPGLVEGDVEVTGLLRAAGKKGSFTPDNDVARNQWYWRDIEGMLRAAFWGSVPEHVSYVLDADEAPTNPGGWPKGGTTLVKLPNRHLEYALTWFGLAATLVVVFLAYAWGRLWGGPAQA